LADNKPLNPEPLIQPPAAPQETPEPLEICEKVRPETAGEIVATGVAGHVIDDIAVYDTAVCALVYMELKISTSIQANDKLNSTAFFCILHHI
jgi:hypothetical protein